MVNTKIAAVAVAAIIVVAAVGAFFLLKSEGRNEEINLVLGLEAEGSAIYYNADNIDASDLFVTDSSGNIVVDSDGNVTYRAAGWGGLIFGIPGTAAIQFYQIKTIVESYLSDSSKVENGETASYTFKAWSEGTTLASNEVGYIVVGSAADTILSYNSSTKQIDIGITWQPQIAKLTDQTRSDLDTPYTVLVTTNVLFPDQTCCVLYANASFVSEHRDVAVRTVWAFIQATNWINDAIAAGEENEDDENFQALLTITANVAGTGFTSDEIVEALKDVGYAWGTDNTTDPLDKVKEDIANQTDQLYDIGGLIDNSLSSLGYSSSSAYADDFVDSSLVLEALQISGTPTYDSTYSLNFSLIAGDMHSIAAYIASTLLPGQTQTFFEQAGIDINIVPTSLGSGVMTALKANEADFGIAAQPAFIIDNINAKLTTAD
ncbi:MAG: ABC transporter substrate-binding protein [Thermoplasmata archaeon]|nr:ABC transporter substrate-binding protein [Thermoplasmata archaeon]